MKTTGVHQSPAGFTLIELMVVVGIIAVVMTMAIPSVYRQLHPDSMQKAVNDIVEACRLARAHAILNQVPMEVRIRPYDRTIRIGSARGGGTDQPARLQSQNLAGEEWRMHERMVGESLRGSPSPGNKATASNAGGQDASSFSAKISELIAIEGIRLNVDDDFTEEEQAAVRFYPNGTSDEFSIILRSDKAEWRMINLEVVTGLPDVKTDPTKFMDYR